MQRWVLKKKNEIKQGLSELLSATQTKAHKKYIIMNNDCKTKIVLIENVDQQIKG